MLVQTVTNLDALLALLQRSLPKSSKGSYTCQLRTSQWSICDQDTCLDSQNVRLHCVQRAAIEPNLYNLGYVPSYVYFRPGALGPGLTTSRANQRNGHGRLLAAEAL